MHVKRKSTYTLKVSSAELAVLLQLTYAAKDFTHALSREHAVANRLAQGALAQAIEDIDPLVLDHVHDVLGDFGLELGID